MKSKSRLILFLFIILMVFAQTIGTVQAQTVSNKTSIIVSKQEAMPGDTVQVEVSINNNPGVLGAILSLDYDSDLTLINAECGEAFSSLSMTLPGRFVPSCKFTWDGLDLDDSDIKDGTILKLTFKVSESLQESKNCYVSVSYKNGDIIDRNLNPVNVNISNSYISVENGLCSHNYISKVTQPTSTIDGYITYICSKCNKSYVEYPDYLKATGEQIDNIATISVSDVIAKAGDTVTVDVNISNNSGILGAILKLEYSPYLTLVNAVNGDAFSSLSMTAPGNYSSPCRFTWDGLDLYDSDIKNGTILRLIFEVSSDTPNDEDCYINLSYKSGDLIDKNLNSINVNVNNGKITVGGQDKPEHNYIIVENIEPTCENDGMILYQCPDCGDIHIEEPKALGHNVVIDKAIEASCTENGLTEGSHCDRCNKVLVVQEIIKATGHNMELYRKTATCEKSGYEIYKCSHCSKLETKSVQAYGHDYSFVKNENGYVNYICNDCNATNVIDIDELYAMWDVKYINTNPTRGSVAQLLNVENDNIINAKDYAIILHSSLYH